VRLATSAATPAACPAVAVVWPADWAALVSAMTLSSPCNSSYAALQLSSLSVILTRSIGAGAWANAQRRNRASKGKER
jgi:hypothetical protein